MVTHTRAAAGHFHFRISFKRRGGGGGERGKWGDCSKKIYAMYATSTPTPNSQYIESWGGGRGGYG